MRSDATAPTGLRLTIAVRLLLVLAGIAGLSTVLAVATQDRALSRDLLQAAESRLERSVDAANRLVDGRLEALAERYASITRTPELRATVEIGHGPTLDFFADELREREGVSLVAFVGRDGEVLSLSGDAALRALALDASEPTLRAHAGRAWFVVPTFIEARGADVGSMIAVDPVAPELLADWSQLSGAVLRVEPGPGPGSTSEALTRPVRSLGDLDLVAMSDLDAERTALRNSRAELVRAGIVAIVLSLIACAVLARGFARPILELQRGMEQIRAGDFSVRLRSRRGDELGDVGRGFDLMLDDLDASRRLADDRLVELETHRRQLARAQEMARLGSFLLDPESGVMEASEQFRVLFELPLEGKPTDFEELRSRVAEEDRAELESLVLQAIRERKPWTGDFRARLRDGSVRVFHTQALPVEDADGVVRLEGTVQDVTERQRADEQIRYLAYHDSLTGLGNRRLFIERLARAIRDAGRCDGRVGVLMLDLDEFKRINDTLGPSMGDELMRRFTDRLVEACREVRVVGRGEPREFATAIARLAGDEFAILVDDGSVEDTLTILADQIQRQLEQPFGLAGQEIVLHASLGVATWPNDGDDADALLRNAACAMSHAKERGGGQVQVYRASMDPSGTSLLELEQRLRGALEREAFEVHYQPKVSLSTGRVTGFEALVRWRDEGGELILPGHFIPVAERTGLIREITRIVLDRVCEQIAGWSEGPAPPISVNLSARLFGDGEIVEIITRLCQRHGVSPRLLDLEITESAVMVDEQSVVGAIEKLRSLGHTVSLDDFGTGYSSLSFLRRLPVDTVKIDMSFVRNIVHDAEEARLTAAIVSMGKARNLRVVAEGVEHEEQRQLLESWGCDEIQGFLVSPAIPGPEAERLHASLEALGRSEG